MKATTKKVTSFEALVYKACEAIPKGLHSTDYILRVPLHNPVCAGKVSTYGALAAAIGKPKAARAVGGALKRNPFAPAVPCHRVVGANLALTGRLAVCRSGRPGHLC